MSKQLQVLATKRGYVLLVLACFFPLSMIGCSGTIPVNYTAQNIVRCQGRMDIGSFTYLPSAQGKLAPNQIKNTAIGSIYISANVAELVQRATALELEKTGVVLADSSPLRISGDVLELKADDLGYSVDWTYSVRYKISHKSDEQEIFSATYSAGPKKTGKFGMAVDYGPLINEMILSGYNQFIKDKVVRKILSQ